MRHWEEMIKRRPADLSLTSLMVTGRNRIVYQDQRSSITTDRETLPTSLKLNISQRVNPNRISSITKFCYSSNVKEYL